jgi:hypothetical protein
MHRTRLLVLAAGFIAAISSGAVAQSSRYFPHSRLRPTEQLTNRHYHSGYHRGGYRRFWRHPRHYYRTYR